MVYKNGKNNWNFETRVSIVRLNYDQIKIRTLENVGRFHVLRYIRYDMFVMFDDR